MFEYLFLYFVRSLIKKSILWQSNEFRNNVERKSFEYVHYIRMFAINENSPIHFAEHRNGGNSVGNKTIIFLAKFIAFK